MRNRRKTDAGRKKWAMQAVAVWTNAAAFAQTVAETVAIAARTAQEAATVEGATVAIAAVGAIVRANEA
jgi:hypothetical protein